MGVLTSFSVAKKVSEEEIKKYFGKKKIKGAELEEKMTEKIFSEIERAVQNNEIPGLLSPQELAKSMNMDNSVIEKIPELNKFIMVLSKKFGEKSYDKMSLCYFINSLVNVLNLTEDDFIRFHKKNNINMDEPDDEFDDDDDDYPEEPA